MATARSNFFLGRKRTATRLLPRIMLHSSNSQGTKYDTKLGNLSKDNGNDMKRCSRDVGRKHADFALSELSQSKSPKNRTWPEVNNTLVCGYQRWNPNSHNVAISMFQLIDDEQYIKLLIIANRLNEAKNYWKYEDLEEMREFVSSGTKVCTDDNDQRFMFSSWHYGILHKFQASKIKLSENEAFSLFSKIVRRIAFCHACEMVVRNIKFVFTEKQMQLSYVVLEILKDSPEYASRSADIWALGLLFYVLFFGRKSIFTARALIFGMLRKESSERPTVENCSTYLWMNSWLEIPSFHGVISNPAFEFARRIMKVIFNFSTKNEDQVVPAFSLAMCNVQQHLRIMHNIIADSSLAAASNEENVAELPSPSHFAPVLAVITTFPDNATSAIPNAT
ncbi:unnamed protein product [Brugia pahangi]|uniref:Cyclin N-terminal domain-containing protein n=1 Tax=Brugia pahangi TaxID=6280 RepID=A0A0N4T241_BRUPA|nr:unnamed protein product [Brugia pahangi]